MATPAVALLTGLGFEVLALRNPHNQWLKWAATVASITYLALFIVYKPVGPFTNIWPLGMNIYCLAQRCWNHLWLREQHELQRIPAKRRDSGVDLEHEKAEVKQKSTKRHSLLDALDIALAFRGVGWAFEAKGIPKVPSALRNGRTTFAISQLRGALLQYLVLDFLLSVANYTFGPTSAASASLFVKLLLGAIMLLYVRYTMDIPYRILSTLAVLSGLSEPTSWPPLFGLWNEAYTSRRFWSHTWHQGMRLLAEPPMDYLLTPKGLNLLNSRPYASRWARISGNFFIACLDHAYGRIIANGNPSSDYMFFLLQPIAIWVEETSREALVRWGVLHPKQRGNLEIAIGFMSTAVFQSWTFLYFMEGAIRTHGGLQARKLIEPALGISLWGQFMK